MTVKGAIRNGKVIGGTEKVLMTMVCLVMGSHDN